MIVIRPSRTRGLLPALVALSLVGMIADAAAAPSSDNTTIERARAAWDSGSFDVAEALYVEAVERGSLGRSELLEALVKIGASRAIVGRRKQSADAFEMAACIDPAFKLPAEAGKKASTIADKIREEHAKSPPIALTIDTPDRTPAAQEFATTAHVLGARTSLVTSIRIEVKDGTGVSVFTDTAPAQSSLTFRVTPTATWEGGKLVATVAALDSHANRIAEAMATISLDPIPRKESAVATDGTHADSNGHPGFWSRSWPYFLGGAVLAAGTAAVYFGTRPSDEVSITTIRVSPR